MRKGLKNTFMERNMMKRKFFEEYVVILMTTWIGNKLALLFPAIMLLLILMIADYISGMLASKKEALEFPDDKNYGWSSKKSIIGIYKKVGYIFTVFAAVNVDYLLYKYAGEMGVEILSETIFGLLVTIWLVINEIISILENVGRLGVKLPVVLTKILVELKKSIDEKE